MSANLSPKSLTPVLEECCAAILHECETGFLESSEDAVAMWCHTHRVRLVWSIKEMQRALLAGGKERFLDVVQDVFERHIRTHYHQGFTLAEMTDLGWFDGDAT